MMLFSEAGINQEIKVETTLIAMGEHVNTAEGLTIEAIVLHLARNAKSVVGKITSKPYLRVEMRNVNLVAQGPKRVRAKQKDFMRLLKIRTVMQWMI